MRILLINHYAGSPRHGMEFRPYYFCREWVRMGNEVRILAASHSHVRANNPKLDWPFLTELLDGIKYSWCWTPAYTSNNILRIINMMSFLLWLILLLPWLVFIERPKVVIASSTYPLDNIPAWLIARLCGARLCYEVHDLWPLSPIELGGMSPGHPMIRVMQWAENFAYRHCDVCVSLLPAAFDHMREHGLEEKKFCYVPNGIDTDEWDANAEALNEEHKAAISEMRGRKQRLVGYLGSHGLANALHTLLEAAERVDDSAVGFVLIGGGPDKQALIELAESKGLGDKVLFLPPVPKRQVPAALQELDILYIGLQRQPLFRFGISPNKIFDYMMAAKPIINGIEAGNDPIEEAQCGRTVPSENPETLANAIQELASLSREESDQLGLNARNFVLATHRVDGLAEKMLNEIFARSR